MTQRAQGWQRSDVIALLSLLVSIAAFGVSLYPQIDRYLLATSASIAVPENGSRIGGSDVTVEGVVGNAPEAGHDLWLVVRPQQAAVWYPARKVVPSPNGRYAVPDVVLGAPDHYGIFIYEADSVASAEFAAWQQKNEHVSDPPGMASLPVTAKLVTAVDIEQV